MTSKLTLAAILIFAAPAQAFPHLGLGAHGVQVEHTHHWWRDDGRKHEQHKSDDSSNGGALTASDVNMIADALSHHQKLSKRPRLTRRQRNAKTCAKYHVYYKADHPFNKPQRLRFARGCTLWSENWNYHHLEHARALVHNPFYFEALNTDN